MQFLFGEKTECSGQNSRQAFKGGLVRGISFLSVGIGILLPKLFWPSVRKTCSSDSETLLKFKAKGQEFVKI